MNLQITTTSQFNKDVKLAKKQGKNIDKLFSVIDKLSKREVLEEKFKDHPLSGSYKGYRECHIEPDWLLIYKVENTTLTLILVRIGSHSDLF